VQIGLNHKSSYQKKRKQCVYLKPKIPSKFQIKLKNQSSKWNKNSKFKFLKQMWNFYRILFSIFLCVFKKINLQNISTPKGRPVFVTHHTDLFKSNTKNLQKTTTKYSQRHTQQWHHFCTSRFGWLSANCRHKLVTKRAAPLSIICHNRNRIFGHNTAHQE